MTKIILHLGMPKSASTFLQNAVDLGLVYYKGKKLVSPELRRMGSNKDLSSGHLHLLKDAKLHTFIRQTNIDHTVFISFENFCSPDFKLTLDDILRHIDVETSEVMLLWIRRDVNLVAEKFYHEGLINGLKNEVRDASYASKIECKLRCIEEKLQKLQISVAMIDFNRGLLTHNLSKSGFSFAMGFEELSSNVTYYKAVPYSLIRKANLLLGWFPPYRILLRFVYKRDIHIRLLITSVPTWWKSLCRI